MVYISIIITHILQITNHAGLSLTEIEIERDKIPRIIKKVIKTDTFPLFTKQRVAGRPFNIP